MPSPEAFRRADAIFEAALDLPPDQRASHVARECGDDAVLRAAVGRLLDAHDRASDFLMQPALELVAPLLAGTAAGAGSVPGHTAELPGQHVGAYRVLRVLGRGGMGTVYLAERDDGQYRQRVALKLIHPAAADEAAVRRFLEERRILAMLEHPCIARLTDAGLTVAGQPYFVMELVEGERIDRYCNERRLSIDQRLELFRSVCEAVHFAHRHFVIHRDLKPANILVTPSGDVKLLDFGIAKLLDPLTNGDETSTLTMAGILPMTPEYATPEQLRGEPVSTATDVYALGIVLHELLTGMRPYEVRGRSLADIERVVCDVDPPRPSATFEASAAEQQCAERAALRGSSADRLRRRLRGDLDAIMLRALRKEPARRYESAQALADDIDRHRSGHPVAARQQTAAYQLTRFARRHRLAIGAGTLILLLTGAYVVSLTLQQQRIRAALAAAMAGTERAEQVTDFMLGLFEAAEGGRALTDTITARELLGRGLVRARELGDRPEMQAQMLDVIGRLYSQLGEYERAVSLIEEALALRRALHGERHPDVVTSLTNLANATSGRQDVAGTVALRQQALALRLELAGPHDPRTLDAVHELSFALHRAGRHDEAVPYFEDWLERVFAQPHQVTREHARRLTSAGDLLRLRGDHERAETLYHDALAIRRELYGDRHPQVASTLTDLALLLDAAGRREEAEPLLREATAMLRQSYPDGHPQLANTLRSWGIVLEHLGRFDEAQPPLREAFDIRRRLLGPGTLDVALVSLDLSYALTMTGAYGEAAALAREAMRVLSTQLGDGNSMVVMAGTYLGDALRGLGRFAEAEPLLLSAYRRFEEPRPVTRQWRRHSLAALARLREAQGRPDEAAAYRALIEAPSSPVVQPATPAGRPPAPHGAPQDRTDPREAGAAG